MPYVTINIDPKSHQLTLDDLFNGVTEQMLAPAKNTYDTRTRFFKDRVPQALISYQNFGGMINIIENFNRKYESIINADKQSYYRSFKIPKRAGGFRQIDAPNEELSVCLNELKHIFEKNFYANNHTAAFAYVKGRSTKIALERHQANGSRWFLKLDFSKFFPSTTPEFLYKMISQLYPFCVLVEDYDAEEKIKKMLSVCFLNGGLPQGTPTSPMLTNMMMIPIDHYIAAYAHKSIPHLVYTRYADDILLSSRDKFDWQKTVSEIEWIVKQFNAPFNLNKEKTRFGSSSGRNWNLGLMYNKDGKITIGHEKKKILKASIFNYLLQRKNNTLWSLEDLQHLQGILSYAKMIEPDEIKKIIVQYSQKFNTDVDNAIKEDIKKYNA